MATPESFSPEEQDVLAPGPKVSELYAMYDDITAKSQSKRSEIREDIASTEKSKNFQNPEVVQKRDYDSGLGGIEEDSTLKGLEAGKKYLLSGGVDKHGFSAWRKRENLIVDRVEERDINWYESLARDAKLFAEIAPFIHVNFPGLKDDGKLLNTIGVALKVSEMTEFTDKAFKQMIKENGFSRKQIYGREGVIQALLAFNRAIDSVDRSLLTEENLIASEDKLPNITIRVELGKKRFSQLTSVEEKSSAPEAVAKTPEAGDTKISGDLNDTGL